MTSYFIELNEYKPQNRKCAEMAEFANQFGSTLCPDKISFDAFKTELEAKVKAGEQISLVDLANAVKADKERGKGAKPEKKPSIRAQLRADKEKAQKKNAKQKSQDLERS